jgi:putative ABC transport system permease protein
MLAATLLFVDDAVHSMTRVALDPVQVEMRALATSLNVDMNRLNRRLAEIPGVRRVDRFASADVAIHVGGARSPHGPPTSTPFPGAAEARSPHGPPASRSSPGTVKARLFAIDPAYLADHPWVRVGFMIATSAVALGAALLAVTRIPAASVLREP